MTIETDKNLKPYAPYAKKNEASKQAANKIKSKLTGKRLEVYNFIVLRGDFGATGSEISDCTGTLLYTAKPRCTELSHAGYIKDSGLMRKNYNGRNETVWVATDGSLITEIKSNKKPYVDPLKDHHYKALAALSRIENDLKRAILVYDDSDTEKDIDLIRKILKEGKIK